MRMDDSTKLGAYAYIDDAIDILNRAQLSYSAPVSYMYPRIAFRGLMAHVAIEHTIKLLLEEFEHTHHLSYLYGKLPCQTRRYLADAFSEAVKFYGLDTSKRGNGHLKSLDTYLNEVGHQGAYDELRFLMVMGEVKYLHKRQQCLDLEILHALKRVVIGALDDTVEKRVDRTIEYCFSRHMWAGIPGEEDYFPRWGSWRVNKTWRDVVREFYIGKGLREGGPLAERMWNGGREALETCTDTAVRYYLASLTHTREAARELARFSYRI